jgi:general secretion pathway protein D
MTNQLFKSRKHLLAVLGLGLCVALPARAQFPGFGGFGGQNQNRSATATARQYNAAGTVGNATISVDPETRQLIVITDAETSEQISQVVTNLDRPKPQVLIKVVFVEVTHADGSDIGVEGGFTGTDKGVTGNAADVFGLSGLNQIATNIQKNALGQPVQSFIPTPPGAGLYQILGQDYQVTLRAIAASGKAKILSRPSILARNNQPANILVGQSVPLITNVRYDTFGNAINSVSYTDVGIILRVTPFITSDGQVEMIVTPEISSISATESVTISTGVQAPVIDKRSADTVVVTPDGQTVIIGGLIADRKTESVSKIPLLGDLPLLGFAFRSTTKKDVKTELLIFLTPHIVQAPSQLAALSMKEQEKAGVTKSLTEEELSKYLDQLPMSPASRKSKETSDGFVPWTPETSRR